MTFDFQPILKSEILEVRPLRADDFDELYAVASDPLIWEQHPNSDRYKPDVFRKFFDEALASGGAFVVLDLKADASSVHRDLIVTISRGAKSKSAGRSSRDLIGEALTTAN
jgi:RimJ/RimL family protein N-acetyltransferase